MADGNKFDPNKMTAASWFYPLGTRVRVSVRSRPQRSVLVTITDRGPAKRLVRRGRIIDLARAAFAQIARLKVGLVHVSVQPIERQRRPGEPGCTAVVEEAGPRGRVTPLRHFKWKP